MDKYEYKVRADEIKELIELGEYAQAAEIADTIDWRRVKSVMMLCTISDLYKINRRYEDAKNMLDLAYERRPGGRTICYALSELCIKTEDFVGAVKYYNQFVQAAPKDSGRYILQYKLYEAQDVSLEERIGVLEELKKRDYREKWAYELAYLYHRVGLATRCVEECDELILWFGDGKYVIKAMELKMLHQPLTTAQQEKYDHRFDTYSEQPQEEEQATEDQNYGEAQIYVDMQSEPAEPQVQESELLQADTQVYEGIHRVSQPLQNAALNPGETEELDFRVKTMEISALDVEAEVRAGMQEVMESELSRSEAITRSIVAPMMETESLDYPELSDEDVSEEDVDEGVEQIESTEVFFGETGELNAHQTGQIEVVPEEDKDVVPEFQETFTPLREIVPELSDGSRSGGEIEPELSDVFLSEGEVELAQEPLEEQEELEESTPEPLEDALSHSETAFETAEMAQEAEDNVVQDETAQIVMNQLRMENISQVEQQAMVAQPPRELAGVLSQESDGQISLVVPERETVEKQITGQLSIADILSEWEQMKRETEARRKEEVRQRVLQQTGPLFTEFEASRDGLLEQLESGQEEDIPEEELKYTGGEEARQDGTDIEDMQDTADELSRQTENFEDENVLPESGDDYVSEPPEENFSREDGLDDLGEVEELEEIHEDPDSEAQEEALGGNDYESGSEPDQPEAYEDTEDELTGQEEVESGDRQDESSGEGDQEEELPEGDGQPDFYEVDIAPLSEGEDAADSDSNSSDTGAEEAFATDDVDTLVDTDAIEEESLPEQPPVEREQTKVRSLTREEKELFGPYIQSKSAREQLVNVLDNISMASYTGNVIITGGEGMDTGTLAKNIVREVQVSDSNFSGKVAKISGQALNKKDVEATLQQLKNGALIIQKASGMDSKTAAALHKALQGESLGIIVVMEDTRKAMERLLEQNKNLTESFTARMDVEALSNDTLVSFGKQYAREREHSIDDLGMLALHTRIEELQTIDHAVTVMEVKEIVDEAIRHAGRKNLRHFVDVLLAKRYDEEDMIILTEKDFA